MLLDMTTPPPPAKTMARAAESFHSMLSQLSFMTDVPLDEIELGDPAGFTWNGLLCLSLDEGTDDLFFDAQESLGENSSGDVSPSSSASVVLRVHRGGDDHQSKEKTSQDTQGPVITESPVSPHFDTDGDHLHRGSPDSSMEAAPVQPKGPFDPLVAPPPPDDLPVRFLRAGKGDPEEGQRRYEATLAWRKEKGINHILTDAHPDFELIKKNYPHYYHLRGRNGEPVFFEQPPKTNLQAMKDGGVVLEGLLHHYAMVTEFQWQFIERDDFARSITVLDLEGMRMMDFVGECVEYVRKCSEFTGQHYPERAGFVFVINVPGWFAMIWNVVKPMVDEVTLKKINIIRGKQEIFEALLEKIPIENIPPEYGGQSVPLGESPEEHLLRDLMRHNNAVANGDLSCGGRAADPPCRFCSFTPARSY